MILVVLSLAAFGSGGGDVEVGPLVDIALFCETVESGLLTGFDTVFGGAISDRTSVCTRVLTTSRGHVIAPANPPPAAPVSISSGIPISDEFLYHFAAFWNCS